MIAKTFLNDTGSVGCIIIPDLKFYYRVSDSNKTLILNNRIKQKTQAKVPTPMDECLIFFYYKVEIHAGKQDKNLKNGGGRTEELHVAMQMDPYLSPGTKLFQVINMIICLKKGPYALDCIKEKVGNIFKVLGTEQYLLNRTPSHWW